MFVQIAPYLVAVLLLLVVLLYVFNPSTFGVVCIAVMSAALGSTISTAFLSRRE